MIRFERWVLAKNSAGYDLLQAGKRKELREHCQKVEREALKRGEITVESIVEGIMKHPSPEFLGLVILQVEQKLIEQIGRGPKAS